MKITMPGRVHESIGHPVAFDEAGIHRPQEHSVGRGYQAVYASVTTSQALIIEAQLRAHGEALGERNGTYDNMLANDCFDVASRIRYHLINEQLNV